MEKRKQRGNPDSTAVVKAAAWAWYQHGSGSDLGNAAREYDATRRTRHGPPKPSRYKLEAMRQQARDKSQQGDVKQLPLLDEYEIRSISRQLDSFLDYSRTITNCDNLIPRQKSSVSCSSDDDSLSTISTTTMKIKRNMKKILMRGSWVRHAARVCGVRGGGVVETAIAAYGLQGGRGPWNSR